MEKLYCSCLEQDSWDFQRSCYLRLPGFGDRIKKTDIGKCFWFDGVDFVITEDRGLGSEKDTYLEAWVQAAKVILVDKR